MLTLALGIGFLLFTWLLTALLVRQMSRWVKAEKPTFPRALGILLGMLLLSLPFVVAASTADEDWHFAVSQYLGGFAADQERGNSLATM